MTRKTMTTSLVLGLLGVSLWMGMMAKRPDAQGAPVTPSTAVPNTMAGLLTGKLYPNTVSRSDLMASYHLVSLIDAQGRPAVCATQGTMLTLGGETFLVAYLLPPPPAKSTDPTATAPTSAPAIPANVEAQLTLINMRDVQAIGGIRDVPPPSEVPQSSDVPAAPAAPTTPPGPTAPLGTVAP